MSEFREIRVKDITGYFFLGRPVMHLNLEDGREFEMAGVEPYVLLALNKLYGQDEYEELFRDRRASLFDLLMSIDDFKKVLKDHVESVTISDLNKEYGTYIAYIRLRFNDVIIEKPMIPSHAIYLAILAEKPVYVNEKLLNENQNNQNI